MNAATRRLGRGLGSLIAGGGQASVDQDETPIPHEVENEETVQHSSDSGEDQFEESRLINGHDQLQELALEQVVPNPHQPRKVIDPQAVTELAASIESEGLLQPIVVRPTDHGYELIAGERRWRAHQHLGRPTILARILEVTDLSSASLSLIENLQREELNPVEEALGYQSLIADFDLSQEEVAKRMGKSRSHVANIMRLLQLDGELKRLLSDGELSVGHAKVLLSINDPQQRLAVGRQAVLEGWTVRQTEDALSNLIKQRVNTIPRRSGSSEMFEDLAQTISRTTGRKVKIKASVRGKGTISFSFKDENDLQALVSKFET